MNHLAHDSVPDPLKRLKTEKTVPLKPVSITFDLSSINESAEIISKYISSTPFKEIPQRFRDRLLGLFDGGLPDSVIRALGPAADTSNHIIRLAAAGDFEILATAVRTRKFDSI